MNILGIFYDGADPSAALVRDGEIVAFIEEERLVRNKHAWDYFPHKAIEYCLDAGDLGIQDVDYLTYGWDCNKYSNGFMQSFFTELNGKYHVDPRTRAWQKHVIDFFNPDAQRQGITSQLRRVHGDIEFPEIRFLPHHFTHAFSAYFYSPFEEALVLTLDGSGEEACTMVWKGVGNELRPIARINIPHSLGWYYAAFTEYLGFRAYDGEYKVMGLAAYGEEDPELIDKVRKVLDWRSGGYEVDPYYIFYGGHHWSERFTDKLVSLMGRPPRLPAQELSDWHRNLAFAVQRVLEETVVRLVEHYTKETGLRNLCISGGVGLNIKMNERIYESGAVDDIFIQPICSDTGTSFASAATLDFGLTGRRPRPMRHVYFGPEYDDAEIEAVLVQCRLPYHRSNDIAAETAERIARGELIGWFQGRMEGGPRALGARSILADPRDTGSKDRVNAVIKYREDWRPFCPSMLEEESARYLKRATNAQFMIMGFEVQQENAHEIPAVVHVDQTVRVQLVNGESHPRYERLLREFKRHTGVGVLLNTSFNVKGEPIVTTPHDALRTFFATGLDALSIGNFIVTKTRE